MQSVFWLIDTLLRWFIIAIVASAVLSWLTAFGIIDMRNRFVYTVSEFLNRLTAPALRPIQRYMPNLGGVDISPLILIVLLVFARRLLREAFF